jgi:hypothetical protein
MPSEDGGVKQDTTALELWSAHEEEEDTTPLRQSFSSSSSESLVSSVRASPHSPGTPLLFSDDGGRPTRGSTHPRS